MEALSSLLVGQPLNILLVALLFLAAHVLLRATGSGSAAHPRALLVVASGWTVYAAWEWLVRIRTPEANIRVDLMLIWPVLLLLSIWFTIRAVK
jgi:hypothetical protein